jgi:hypothetical protein
LKSAGVAGWLGIRKELHKLLTAKGKAHSARPAGFLSIGQEGQKGTARRSNHGQRDGQKNRLAAV